MNRMAAFLFMVFVWAPPAFGQVPDEVIKKVMPAVVAIYGDEGAFNYVRGTGFIINAAGDILTNYHVCSDCHRFLVRLYDGRKFETRRIRVWESKDVALLRPVFDQTENKPLFPYLSFNDTTWIASGSPVVAIGHSRHVLWQIIEGNVTSKNYFLKYQPTILYGFSGSPVVNDRGYVVGMNVGSDNREVSVKQDGFYSSAITLNDIKEFLDHSYERKTEKPKPNNGHEFFSIDVFSNKCVWRVTKEGQWCRH